MKTHQNESNTARNIINVAAKLISNGISPIDAKYVANTLQNNPDLIKRINALKQIDILDIATRSYLYGIQLTDNVLQIEPKVNAIWTLVKTAGLIDDSALVDEIPETVSADDDVQRIADDVLKQLLAQ